MAQNLAGAPQRAADDLVEIVERGVEHEGAGFEPRHVEQIGDEAVEPLGFLDHGADELDLLLVGQRAGKIAQRAGGAEDRRERRLEVVGDRGQERGAQPVGLDGALRPVHVLDEMDALDRERALVDQRVEQPALVGREQGARLVAVDPDDADRPAAGPHRQEQPLGARQRVGAAAGIAVVLPGPFGRGDVGFAQHVLGRVSGLDDDGALLGQQDHHPHLEHQRDLVGGRPQHVVERADAGELAAEGVERIGGARPRHRRGGLDAHPCGDVRNERRHDDEEHEGRDIGRIGDREGVDRRQEEEIVAERGDHAREQRRIEAVAHRDGDDRREEHEVDVLDAEIGLDRFAREKREADRHDRDEVGTHLERLAPFRGLHRLLRNGVAGQLVAGDDVDADIAGAADEVVDHRAMQDLEPARARRLAEDDLGDVVRLRVAR